MNDFNEIKLNVPEINFFMDSKNSLGKYQAA